MNCFGQVSRAKEEAREEVLELRLKLKEVETSLESKKAGLEETEETWRRRLEEQLDVVEQLEQANFCNFCKQTKCLQHHHHGYHENDQQPFDTKWLAKIQ